MPSTSTAHRKGGSFADHPHAPEQIEPLPPPPQFYSGFLMPLTVWFAVKAMLGIGFVIGLTRVLGGSIWLGVTIGCAIAFVVANAQKG